MPVRFKYRNVEADNFGLKPTEILSAQDKDLNEYLSIKKLAPFRNTDHDSQWLQRWRKGKKKRQAELRRKLAARERALKEGTSGSEFTWAQPLTGDAASDKKKKKKSKKVKSDNDTDVAAAEEKRDMKRKRVSEEGEDVDQKEATIARDDLNASAEAPIMATDAADATAQKPKKKKKKRPSAPVPSVSVPNDRLAVYAELNTSKEDKFKAKHEERMKKKKNVHRR